MYIVTVYNTTNFQKHVLKVFIVFDTVCCPTTAEHYTALNQLNSIVGNLNCSVSNSALLKVTYFFMTRISVYSLFLE